MTDALRLANAIRRAQRARRFPENTDPASRHAQEIGEALCRGRAYQMLTEEPAHCGESILATVEALWKARTEIARLKAGKK